MAATGSVPHSLNEEGYNSLVASEHLTADKMMAYREGLRRRLSRILTADEEAVLEGAWREARQAAEQLVRHHGAKRVTLFGSVARRGQLRSDWDIDLAVEGMPKRLFLKSISVPQRA